MNNEPVAWMYEKPNGASKLSFVKEKMLWEDMTETPLYAHPVKTLTDEEIDSIGDEVSNLIDTYAGRREFARAILRKAQNGHQD
jgi:hypothetical protein